MKYMIQHLNIKRDIDCDFAYVDGNLNNRSQDGGSYLNLNNTPSNTRWNIGARISYHYGTTIKCNLYSLPLIWKIFRIDKAPTNKKERVKNKFIDFMGYKFYKNNVTLRKSILQSARRKALKIGKKDKPTIYDCKQMLSYLGWIDSSSTYRYYENNIKPIVNFGYLKKRISNYDRKQSMLMKGELLLCG